MKTTGISGRPPLQFNIALFNIYCNLHLPHEMMMKLFNMSRGSYFRYKKKYFTPIDYFEHRQPIIDEDLRKYQLKLFEKYAYKIVDTYSERVWRESDREDYKQECYLKILSELGIKPIKHFIAYCNACCEVVLKELVKQYCRDKKVLFYEDYYFDNGIKNKLDYVFSEGDEEDV